MVARKRVKSRQRAAAPKKQVSEEQLRLPLTEVERLHVEIDQQIKQMLDEVSIRRKHQGYAGYSQNFIVERALTAWFKKHGYAKK